MVDEDKIVDFERFRMNIGYSRVRDTSFFTGVFDGMSVANEDKSLIVEYLVS